MCVCVGCRVERQINACLVHFSTHSTNSPPPLPTVIFEYKTSPPLPYALFSFIHQPTRLMLDMHSGPMSQAPAPIVVATNSYSINQQLTSIHGDAISYHYPEYIFIHPSINSVFYSCCYPIFPRSSSVLC